MVVLSASGVNKSYGVNTILRDITFSVNEGDKIGVLGVNGAGKTTLFRLITGEEQPDEGELYISKQSGVAYMHQHAEYSSDKTAREEVLSVFAKLEDQDVTGTLEQLDAIGTKFGVSIVISISLDKEEIPAAFQEKIAVAL